MKITDIFLKRHKLYAFLDKKIIILLIMGIILAFLMFGIELLFAGILQVFAAGIFKAQVVVPKSLNWMLDSSWLIFLSFVVVGVFRIGLTAVKGYLEEFLSFYFAFIQRRRLIDSYFNDDTNSLGSAKMLTMVTDSLNSATGFLSKSMRMIISGILSVSLFAAILFIAPLETISCSIIGIFVYFSITKLHTKLYGFGKSLNSVTNKTFKHLVAAINNFYFLKISGENYNECNKFYKDFHDIFSLNMRFSKLVAIIGNVASFVAPILLTAVCIIALEIFHTDLSILPIFFYLFYRLTSTLTETMVSLNHLKFNLPKVEFLYSGVKKNILEKKIIKPDFPIKNLSSPPSIEFKNLTFSYNDSDDYILKNFNHKISSGTMLACTGPSGSGKSTLLGLASGILAPRDGSVIVNGLNLNDYEKLNYLKVIGYVGPEPFIIEGSILDNLLYGIPIKPSPYEISKAFDFACIDFIKATETDLSYKISDFGEGLSTGQKQRLCLARGLLREPKLFVLDEATANLDKKTELKILENIKSLKGKITILAATHRDIVAEIADTVVSIDAK